MATMDDGVANLQRFIGHLTLASGALEKARERLQHSAGEFAQLEDQADEQGGGLNERLEELRSQLDTAQQEALASVTEVADAAAEGADLLFEAQTTVEQASARFEETAHSIPTELTEAQARLTTDGFASLASAVEGVGQEVESAQADSAEAWSRLEGEVQRCQPDAEAAWDAGDAALEGADFELSARESALEAAAVDGVHAFETAASEIETACSSLDEGLGTIYDSFASSAAEEGQELAQAVQGLAQAMASFVESGGRERVDAPFAAVADEALGPLGEEYAAVGAALEAAAGTASDLEPLTEELEKSRGVVGQIDDLLNAIAG